MSRHQHRQTWAIARLLFATHLPLLLVLWAIFAVIVVGVGIGLAIFNTVTFSVWDGATKVVRWFALGYGIYLIHHLLPTLIAHGQTRRTFMLQASLFTVVATIVLGALMTLGYVLETAVYRALDWQPALTAAQAFISVGRLPMTFFTCLAMFLVWTVSGALLGAGFYRAEELALVTLPIALLLISAAGVAIGYTGLPFIGIFIDRLDIPLAVAGPLSAGAFLLGLWLIWVIVRDIPLRKRTA